MVFQKYQNQLLMDAQLETAVCRSPPLSLEAAVNYSNCTILQITLESVFQYLDCQTFANIFCDCC